MSNACRRCRTHFFTHCPLVLLVFVLLSFRPTVTLSLCQSVTQLTGRWQNSFHKQEFQRQSAREWSGEVLASQRRHRFRWSTIYFLAFLVINWNFVLAPDFWGQLGFDLWDAEIGLWHCVYATVAAICQCCKTPSTKIHSLYWKL